jgi:hypothetical protein
VSQQQYSVSHHFWREIRCATGYILDSPRSLPARTAVIRHRPQTPGIDCRSVGLRLRRFESCTCHQVTGCATTGSNHPDFSRHVTTRAKLCAAPAKSVRLRVRIGGHRERGLLGMPELGCNAALRSSVTHYKGRRHQSWTLAVTDSARAIRLAALLMPHMEPERSARKPGKFWSTSRKYSLAGRSAALGFSLADLWGSVRT